MYPYLYNRLTDIWNALGSGTPGFQSSGQFTRPANTTAYGAGDVVGAADTVTPANAGSAILTFANAGPAGGHVLITEADLRIDLAAVPSGMTTFRLNLYDVAPTAILDNAVWDLPAGDRAAYLGYVDLGTVVDVGLTLFVQATGLNKQVKLATASTSLYGLLVTAGAYTPGSGTVYAPRLRSMRV